MINVVIVEDSVIESELYEAYLQDSDINVTVVNNPKDALHTIQEANPDLILLDVNMPELDGFALGKLIKQHRNTPIIFLTDSDDPESLIASISLGSVNHLTKPISASKLLTTVRGHGHGLVSWATECLQPAIFELSRLKEKYQ